MGIKLTPKFNINDLRKVIDNDVQRIENDLLERFQMVGDEFVIMARENGSYKDRTGNLRSSVGYIVFKDGKPIYDDFRESDKGTDRATGKQKGYDVASEFEDIPKKGFCLVCVAGMDYAAAVEALEYDVISGSSLVAEKLLRESLQRLKNKL